MALNTVEIARKQFELENGIAEQQLYLANPEEQEAIMTRKPWKEDVKYFRRCQISAVALVKMVTHARSGGELEVMGLMQGKIMGDAFVILDCFPLPVEGTETRVNAGAQANEFMINYVEGCETINRTDNVVGWYHSHPGYGCWLSGIDVATQTLNQQHQEPFVACVIDPTRTCATGKVELGAFRTYPADYTAPDVSEVQTSIPLEKVDDFGVHCGQYYALEVEYFRSALDTLLLERLWSKYWITTLSASPLLANLPFFAKNIRDCVAKLEALEGPRRKKEDSALANLAKGAAQNANDQLQGLAAQALKFILFVQQARDREPMDCS